MLSSSCFSLSRRRSAWSCWVSRRGRFLRSSIVSLFSRISWKRNYLNINSSKILQNQPEFPWNEINQWSVVKIMLLKPNWPKRTFLTGGGYIWHHFDCNRFFWSLSDFYRLHQALCCIFKRRKNCQQSAWCQHLFIEFPEGQKSATQGTQS